MLGFQGVQFVVMIIMARLLLPEEFGLVGMLTIFMAVAQTLVDSGFGHSLIQKSDATADDETSAFYFNIVVAICGTAALWLSAPAIAEFYQTPALVVLTRALSVNILINAFGVVQTALMTKRVDFKRQTQVTITASLVSGVIGVTLAYLGYGVWSLVAQSISVNAVRTSLLWIVHSWRPTGRFRFDALGAMFPFGSRLLASSLLETVFQNIYLVLIGRLFSAADLGFYTRARTFTNVPSSTLSGVVGRVTFPVFSSIQSDKARLKRGVQGALATLAMINFPLMAGLAAVAGPLVNVLLTDKWAPCVPYLQLLCGMGLLYPLHAVNLNVLKAQGRSDLFFRLEVMKKVLVIVAIAITYRWGISALIIGGIASSLLAYLLNSYYSAVFIDYSWREQVWDVMPYLLLSMAMGLCVMAVGQMADCRDVVLLALQVVCGICTYVAMARAFRLAAFEAARQSIARVILRGRVACSEKEIRV